MPTENYVCFYTTNPFWAGESPDLSGVHGGASDAESRGLQTIMSEEVFAYTTKAYTIKVCKDGLLMVQIAHLDNQLQKSAAAPPDTDADLRRYSKYLEHLNAIQLLLDCAVLEEIRFDYLETALLRQNEVFGMTLRDGSFIGSGIPRGQARWYYLGRYATSYPIGVPLAIDPRISVRHNLPRPVFDRAIAQFDRVCGDDSMVETLSHIAAAVGAFNALQFSTALVQAWSVIEYLLNRRWIDFIAERTDRSGSNKRLNRKRLDYLVGRDFSAAAISQVLELAGKIDSDMLRTIDAVRNRRNGVVHSLDRVAQLVDNLKESPQKKRDRRVTPENCRKAFGIIRRLVQEEFHLDLAIAGSLSYQAW